jgi:hypothetical protein
MNGEVWRVPTLFGVMAVSALSLFAAGVLRAVVVAHRPSKALRASTSVVLVLLAIAVAIFIRATATQIARALQIDVGYVAPGPLGYLAPTVFAVFAFVVGQWLLQGAWTTRRALLFYLWLIVFTGANVINWCSPGWCETIGFPLPWRHESDSIVVFSDSDFTPWISAIGLPFSALLNLLLFVAVAGLLTRTRVSNRPT